MKFKVVIRQSPLWLFQRCLKEVTKALEQIHMWSCRCCTDVPLNYLIKWRGKDNDVCLHMPEKMHFSSCCLNAALPRLTCVWWRLQTLPHKWGRHKHLSANEDKNLACTQKKSWMLWAVTKQFLTNFIRGNAVQKLYFVTRDKTLSFFQENKSSLCPFKYILSSLRGQKIYKKKNNFFFSILIS